MNQSFRKKLGKRADAQSLSSVLKEVFPIGSSAKVSERVAQTLGEPTTDALLRTVVECRQSKEHFSKWVFRMIDTEGAGCITEAAIGSVLEDFAEMTGISSERPEKQTGISEQEFVEMCMHSKSFDASWRALRKHTQI
ncbi:hypothetical protein NECID01_1130 [Nematocida sp. AWRm77]|nr:hypothetical protein NECID01_1130 [Nematocida sp. AWRm77]